MFLRQICKYDLFNKSNSLIKPNRLKLWHPKESRELHTCSMVSAKIYIDRENMHAHQVLEQSLKPYQIFPLHNGTLKQKKELSATIFSSEYSTQSIDEVFEDFKSLCNYCQQTNTFISEQKFNAFVRVFCDKIHLLNDEQLKDALHCLTLLPPEESIRSPNFIELWNCLDIECCRRIEKWKTDQLLLICDAWYSLNLARVCDFVWEALRKLGRRVGKMSPSQLVQTMFMCNVMRRQLFDMFDFEVNLNKCVQEMTMSELGVMSMGFFKTKTPIRNTELLEYMYKRLIHEIHTVDDITFVAILKVLRYSSKLPQVDIMMQLLDKISKEKLDSMNLLTSLHVALLGCELQCSHDEIIEKILYKFESKLETTRLKDLERISLVIALFNIRTPGKIEDVLCSKILKSLNERTAEIIKHPRCFSNCLHFLSLRDIHDCEMISTVLDTKFLKHSVGSNFTFSRDIFHLDTYANINLEREGYKGNQLLEKHRKTMGKMLTHYIPERGSKFKLSATDNVALQIKEVVATFLPTATFKHILPNYERPDIVICYDRSSKEAVQISEDCPENYSGVILTRDHLLGKRENSDSIDTVAIVIGGWNNVVRGKDRHTGLFDMKLKQLRLLQHKYIVIYWHEWRSLETHNDRITFIKRRLTNVLKI